MKTLEELLKQEPVYLHDWSETKKEGLYRDFENVSQEVKSNANILFATYNYKDYSGYAFVLLEKYGKLYEVNGSHCYCYGLEGQWELEETSLEAIRDRLVKGRFGVEDWNGGSFNVQLKEFLGITD